MVKMHKLTKGGQTIFPATIYDAVVNPQTRKSLATEIAELAPNDSLSNYVMKLVDKSTTLYDKFVIRDNVKIIAGTKKYVNDSDYLCIEISREDSPAFILFKDILKNTGNTPTALAYIDDDTGGFSYNTEIGTYSFTLNTKLVYTKVSMCFAKNGGKIFLENLVNYWNKEYDIPVNVLSDYKVRGNSMLDLENALLNVRFIKGATGYMQNSDGWAIYPIFKVKNTDKIWANQYYSVTFFILDNKGTIITNGSFKTQTGMGLPASYFQIADYADIADMEEVNMIITSSVSSLVITNDSPSNSAEYWIKNPDLLKEINAVEEAPVDDRIYGRKNAQWERMGESLSLAETKTYNLFNGNLTNAYLDASTGAVVSNPSYRITDFIECPSEGIVSVQGVTSGHIYCYTDDGTYIPKRELNTQGGSSPYLMFAARKGTSKIRFEYHINNKTGDLMVKLGGGGDRTPYISHVKQAVPTDYLYLYQIVHNWDVRTWWTDKITDTLGDSISQNPGYQFFIDRMLGTMSQWHGIGGTRISGSNGNAFWQDIRINALAEDAVLINVAGGTNDRGSYTLGDISISNHDTNTLCGAINVLLSKLYYRYMKVKGYYNEVDYTGINQVLVARNINILFVLPPHVCETSTAVNNISADMIKVLNLWGVKYVESKLQTGINDMNKTWFYSHYTDDTIIDPTHGGIPYYERIAREIIARMMEMTPIADIEAMAASTRTYTVTMQQGNGYQLEAYNNSVSPVSEGGEFSVKLTIQEGYDGSSASVKANGDSVAKDSILSTPGLDIYTVKNIMENVTISVEGIVMI